MCIRDRCEPDQQEQLVEYLKEDPAIGSFLPMQTDSVKVINEAGKEEKVQLYVLPEDAPLDCLLYTSSRRPSKWFMQIPSQILPKHLKLLPN